MITRQNTWRGELLRARGCGHLGRGSLPVFGSLPNTNLVGKLPTSAGWQPALPRVFARKVRPKPIFELINANPSQKNRSGF